MKQFVCRYTMTLSGLAVQDTVAVRADLFDPKQQDSLRRFDAGIFRS
jgi:hypothetical protein